MGTGCLEAQVCGSTAGSSLPVPLPAPPQWVPGDLRGKGLLLSESGQEKHPQAPVLTDTALCQGPARAAEGHLLCCSL